MRASEAIGFFGLIVTLGAGQAACLDDPPPRTPTNKAVRGSAGHHFTARGRGGSARHGHGHRAAPGPRVGPALGSFGMRGARRQAAFNVSAYDRGTLLDGAPWIGGRNATVVVQEFTDFECPYCRRGWRTSKKLLAHYGKRIKLVFRHLPLSFHKQARIAAIASVSAGRQGKFWQMANILFDNQAALSRKDLILYARRLGLDAPRFTRDLDAQAGKVRIDSDKKLARAGKVEGTPCFFVNRLKAEGAQPFTVLKKLIDAALGI